MISILAAIDSKRGLGKNGKIPWHISEDFKRLKEMTMGHPLIMGRKTFESLGRKLPGRIHIVITRDSSSLKNLNYQPDIIASSLEEGLEKAKQSQGSDEIIIFGGGQIFKEAIEKGLVDMLYLTVVEGDYGADTFFPDYSMFKEVSREDKSDEDYKYSFLTLEK